MDYKYTCIDLFSGPGGLCTGLRWSGIKALIAVEWSYWTVQTYAASHGAEIFDLEKYLNKTMENPEKYFQPSDRTLLIYGDINKVEIPLVRKILNYRFNVDTVDLVTGGAPCESFSMAGNRKEDDDRNVLYKNILRIARGVDSKMFLFENVKGLLSKKLNGVPGAMFQYICDEFQSQIEGLPSYKLCSTEQNKILLKANEYGVPQARERIFLVGINRKFTATYKYPEPTHGPNRKFRYITVGDAIMDLPQISKGDQSDAYNFDLKTVTEPGRLYFLNCMRGSFSKPPKNIEYTNISLYNHKAPGHTTKMLNRISVIKPGENMKKAYERLVKEGKEDFVKENFPNKLYAARNRRLLLTEPSFTVTSHCLDEMIHPTLNRGLTPREVARLQSFPDWYQFRGPFVKFHSDPQQDQYEQIGDAIPPLLGYALGKEIRITLDKIIREKSNV